MQEIMHVVGLAKYQLTAADVEVRPSSLRNDC